MIALIMGLGAGAGVMTVVGLTTVFLRKLRLLWGDRRIWISIMTVLTLLAGLDFKKWETRTTPTPGDLEQAFENCLAGGFVVGVLGIWAILFGILFSWGKKWKAPLVGWSWAISVTLLLFGILAGVTIPEVEKNTQLVDQPLTQESIQGIWHLVESKVSGKPNESASEGILHISGNECSRIFRDKETITAVFTLNADADPVQVIWEYPEQNGDEAGEIREIVRLDGNRLIFSSTNDGAIAPTEFWKTDEGHSTTVYQRKEANQE